MARNDQKRTGITRVGSSRAAHRLVDGYAVGVTINAEEK